MTDGQSKVLTLVFTDLADSTALKTEHGDGVVSALIARHRDLVTDLASDYSGRIIDWAGDGCFLTFETPSNAVYFALRLQLRHKDDPDLPGVRIGIHMGEISDREHSDGSRRVEGLTVDLAARISGLAHPGQVLMSSAVANSVRQRIDSQQFEQAIRWEGHGSYLLKGFDEPLDIREAGFEGVAKFVAPTVSEKARPATQRRHRMPIAAALVIVLCALLAGAAWLSKPTPEESKFDGRAAIAVLPFDNLSPDPEDAYFADGLAEDLITRLGSWRAFPVIARNSSFQYRDSTLDLKDVGVQLGARYLVGGSVSYVGNRIRVTARLINAPTGEQVWTKRYDRVIEDMFVLQDEIGSTIAAQLVGDLTRAEGERARQVGTENLEAWSFYQLGLQHTYRYTTEDSIESVRLFQRALEQDPTFATALARVAMAHWVMASGDGSVATEEELDAALTNARKAVELDPLDPVAHAALASVYLGAGDPKNALDAARRAVELNPSMPEAQIWFGWSQLLAGDPKACIVATERALKLDPQGPMVWIYDSLALAYWETGQYEAALEAGRRLVAVHPTYLTGHLYVAMSEVSLGNMDRARAAIAEGRRMRPDLSIESMQNYLAVSRPEIDALRNAALREAGLE